MWKQKTCSKLTFLYQYIINFYWQNKYIWQKQKNITKQCDQHGKDKEESADLPQQHFHQNIFFSNQDPNPKQEKIFLRWETYFFFKI